MKVYQGRAERTERGGFYVTVVDPNTGPRPLEPRNDLFNHSPDGFAWGYGGSAPAQLALALAADVLGDDEQAVAIHQRLKSELITWLPQDQDWNLTEAQVLSTIKAIRRMSHV